MNELILIIFSLISWTSFVTYISIKYGVQKSVSDSFYAKKHDFIFPIAIIFTAMPMMGVGAITNSIWLQLSALFMATVAATPKFKNKQEGIIHVIGALGAIIFGMLHILSVDFRLITQYVAILIIIISYILFRVFKLNNLTWWIENVAYYVIMYKLIF